MATVYLRNRLTNQVHAVDDEARLDGGTTSLSQGGDEKNERGGVKMLTYYLQQQLVDGEGNLVPKFERVEEPSE